MNKLRLAVATLLALPWLAAAQAELERSRWLVDPLTPDGAVVWELDSGRVTATNGVVIRYENVVLTSERVILDQASGEAEAEGAVRVQREEKLWTGEKLRYNFLTGAMEAREFKTGIRPFFLAGENLQAQRTNETATATNAVVTTDDYAKPAHRVRARSLVIARDYVEVRHATFYLGNTPVFYLPYWKRYLKRHPNYFEFLPGYRSRDGAYLLSTYNWYLSDQLDGALHLDFRTERGFGGGPDVSYHLGPQAEGTARYYYLHDWDPTADPSIPPPPEDRQRFWFSHRTEFTNLTAKVVARYQSDAYVVRDFFEPEYRENVQPNSFFEAEQLLGRNFTLNVFAQPRLNDFSETVERLPDVRLSGHRQQLGISPFYYESESSLGYYRHRYADDASPSYAAVRADTLHQVLLPWTLFGWLNFTPRVGGRFTHYGEADGTGTTTAAEDRWVFNTGAELSFKVSKIWRNSRSQFLDVNGLRHIFQPSLNYVYVPSPSVAPPELPQFDTELPSLRLLPVNFPDYNAIDSIDSQNVLRVGLRNKLQTKRADGIENLLSWDLYGDWRIKPRPDQTTFSDIFSDLDLRPRSWLTLTSELRYSVDNGWFQEANHYLTLQPGTRWSVSLGHRFLRDDPTLGPDSGNNLILSRIYYRLNENWGFRADQHYEARDGVMEEQQYTVYRDLRSWTAALSVRFRDNRTSPNEFTVALTVSLKAFPRLKVGDDSSRPELLLGN